MDSAGAEAPVVVITAAAGVLRGAVAAVFQQAGWKTIVLGSDDPAAAVRQAHRERGRVDAWVYVPPMLDDDASSFIPGADPVAALEAGGRAVREIVDLQARGGAVVVYISLEAVSVAAESPCASSVHAALLAAVRSLGVTWARQSVRVNAVLAPIGPAFARVHPTRYSLRRLAMPEDLAWPAVFLASSEASYVTAEALCVDGGFLCYQYF